jgi:hypothetical protein
MRPDAERGQYTIQVKNRGVGSGRRHGLRLSATENGHRESALKIDVDDRRCKQPVENGPLKISRCKSAFENRSEGMNLRAKGGKFFALGGLCAEERYGNILNR